MISALPASLSTGQDDLAVAFEQIEQQFKAFAIQKRVPGLAFGILMDGKLVYAGAYGLRNVSRQAPVTTDSVFRIASMTKSITAMCLVKLRDEGKLRLDDTVATHVPELATLHYPTSDSAPLTIRDLLTMSSGLPQDDPWADRHLAVDDDFLSKLLNAGLSFSNPPGIAYEYSNLGYAVLGRIVTNVAGIPYQEYATRNILEPLGMNASGFDVNRVAADRLAMGYRLEGDTWVEEPPLRDGAFASIGGLFTTIPDFARYIAFLLSAFPPRDEPEHGPVRRSSAREMQQSWRQNSVTASRSAPDLPLVVQSQGYGYGLACGIDSVLGYSVMHGGGLPGYGSFYRLLPAFGVGIVAFTNLTYSGPRLQIYDALCVLKKNGDLKPRPVRASSDLQAAREGIIRLYEKWDDAQTLALATESFFQDMPLEKRREQFEKLRSDLGECLSVTDLEPENALRGRWTMTCERGSIECFITLAPINPPRTQFLQITVARPLSAGLQQAAQGVLRLQKTWADAEFRKVFSASVRRTSVRSQFQALHSQYGSLKATRVLESDGQSWARIRLTSELGAIDMRLALDARSCKVCEIAFTQPREVAFML